MKKLWFFLLFSIISIGVFAQEPFDYSTMPDTIPNLGSRLDFRNLLNWSALHNRADGDSLGLHLARLQALEATGGEPTDTFVIDSVAHMLSDSVCFPFALGSRLPTDTMLMHDKAYMGGWYNEQDTCVSLKTRYKAYGTGASIPFRILSGDSIDVASPTVILSSTATNVLQETATYTNNKTPRDKKIWCEINGEPSTSGVLIEVDHEVAHTRY